MKLNLALAAALSLTNNVVSVSAESTLAAEEIEELNTLFAEELHLEEQNEEILGELNSLSQTRFDIGGGEEEEGEEEEEGGDIVLNFDAPDLRVEDEEGEGYDELPEDGIAYTTSAMEEEDNSSNEEEEVVHVPTKHELHHAAKIAAKANKHHDMLSKAHSMKSVEKKTHSKAAKAIHHGSKGSKRGKMGKAHLSMPHSSGKANKMPIHHEAKTQKAPSSAVKKSTSQSASSSSKANKATDSNTESVPMPIEAPVPAEGDDDVTELNMEPVPRTPDVSPSHQGVDTSALNGRLKQEMAEVMLGDTSHVGKGHSQSNENVAALDLLRAKSDAAAQSSGGSVVGRSVGIVGGVCLVGSILYGLTMV